MKASPDFVFRAVSGAVVYTAISVINALKISARTTSSFISVSPISSVPGLQYHVHTGNCRETSRHSSWIFSLVFICCCYMIICLSFCLSAVLQFVPSHVDVRMCTFSEQAEKGLITALSEVRRRSQESTNFTVNVRWLLYSAYGIKSSAEFQTPITRHWTP